MRTFAFLFAVTFLSAVATAQACSFQSAKSGEIVAQQSQGGGTQQSTPAPRS